MLDYGSSLLDSVKNLLGLTDDTSKDILLQEIITNVHDQLLLRTGYEEIPSPLHFIIKEVSCSRYNKLGSEGIHSELNEGIQFIYNKDIFAEYEHLISDYINNHPPKNKKRFRMI